VDSGYIQTVFAELTHRGYALADGSSGRELGALERTFTITSRSTSGTSCLRLSRLIASTLVLASPTGEESPQRFGGDWNGQSRASASTSSTPRSDTRPGPSAQRR
jgi:hypothetical protein